MTEIQLMDDEDNGGEGSPSILWGSFAAWESFFVPGQDPDPLFYSNDFPLEVWFGHGYPCSAGIYAELLYMKVCTQSNLLNLFRNFSGFYMR